MDPKSFFSAPQNSVQKQYEALRSFFISGLTAKEAADRFGYTLSTFYSLVRDFRKKLEVDPYGHFFFVSPSAGRKPKDETGEIDAMIIGLRKKYLSVVDIKTAMDVQGLEVSERYIYNLLQKEGFDRLPRRDRETARRASSACTLPAPKSFRLDGTSDAFVAQNTLGVLCLLPYLQAYGIDTIIKQSAYPHSKTINRLSSILAFVALKLSDVRRYSADDVWCMDRGLGLFAGLNVLPKAAWYSSYSSRVTREMNRHFLKVLYGVWDQYGFLSDTTNLDFTTVPYWGDDSHLENHWSGKRNRALSSILAVLAQDPDSGIITYGDTTIRRRLEDNVCLEFLDFSHESGKAIGDPRYLVFDAKFTTYENLSRLNASGIRFITIRRRGKNIVADLNQRPASAWKTVKVMAADGKGRTLKIIEESIQLARYDGTVRQIAITGHGKIKPALIITNDFSTSIKDLIRKYVRRWIVEKGISEQIEFFHLNQVSSSMVIKVDFDLTMSILAHNLLRLFAMDLEGHTHDADTTLYEKFLSVNGSVQIEADRVIVKLKKKRNLPAILTAMAPFQNQKIAALGGKQLEFVGDTCS
jgi:transposase